MPGRQSTGLTSRKRSESKNKTRKRTLNAFAIAELQNPDRRGVRKGRLGETEQSVTKRRRNESEEDAESEDERRPGSRPKKLRAGDKDRYGEEIEGGSDSEGNEWVTGAVDSNDDSSLCSDEAMGDSDLERFDDFTFRGSSSKNSKKGKEATSNKITENNLNLSEDGIAPLESDEESDEFAADAVDLADVLDATSDEDVLQPKKGSNLLVDEASYTDEEASGLSVSDDANEEDDAADKFSALRDLVSSMSNENQTSRISRSQCDNAQEAIIPSKYGLNSKQKLTIADLLPTIKDSKLRKSVKMMDDNRQNVAAGSKGIPGKLEVPLAKRQQDRLDRAAAYKKSKETLNRWVDTVKHNRRAEHLVFPLPEQDPATNKEVKRLILTSQSKPATDLESTIQHILSESGLASNDGRLQEDKIQAFEELGTSKMSVEETQARRAELRRTRELLFREEIRAKRIKKIKSKSYRRVHRRERERNALRDKEALQAAEVDFSENEQDRLDRLRAEERMGARHRESKWAKGLKGTRRAAWDEDARRGVTEMAQRNEELRNRIHGKDLQNPVSMPSASDSSDDELSDEEDEDDFTTKMKNKFSRLTNDCSEGTNDRLSSLKFMQKVDAVRKAQNDKAIEEMRRELDDEDSPSDEVEIAGRRRYGPDKAHTNIGKNPFRVRSEFEEPVDSGEDDDRSRQNKEDEVEIITDKPTGQNKATNLNLTTNQASSRKDKLFKRQSDAIENPWLSIPRNSPRPGDLSEKAILISTTPGTTSLPSKPDQKHTSNKPAPLPAAHALNHDSQSDSDSASFTGFSSTPTSPEMPNDNAALIRQAFASDDVVVAEAFASEKAAFVEAEKPVKPGSLKLPGWGSWVGAGLSKKDKRGPPTDRDSLPNTAKKGGAGEGTAPEKRKDRALEKVIVSEKRMPKSAKYLASSLPHPFETRAQYERSMRLPMGQEWTTKETFQGMTKPRVITKGGLVAPIRKPLM